MCPNISLKAAPHCYCPLLLVKEAVFAILSTLLQYKSYKPSTQILLRRTAPPLNHPYGTLITATTHMSKLVDVAPGGDLVVAISKKENTRLAKVSSILLTLASSVF